jgi:threonine dehydrogenase-like Zn-dependent dehydrogenase
MTVAPARPQSAGSTSGREHVTPSTMKAAVFTEPGRIVIEEKPVPKVGPRDALMRVTTTTICGTDVHILKGEYPVARGLTVGHEPVGVIEQLGEAVTGYVVGQRVLSGAITPCGQCWSCLGGSSSQCGGKAMGGWRLGNTIDGCQAGYVLIPDAMANLAPIPDHLTDEQVLMCPDIMSTGFSAPKADACGSVTPSPCSRREADRGCAR